MPVGVPKLQRIAPSHRLRADVADTQGEEPFAHGGEVVNLEADTVGRPTRFRNGSVRSDGIPW